MIKLFLSYYVVLNYVTKTNLMDLIGFNGSMEKNHLMEDTGNVNGEVKKVSFILAVGLCVDRNCCLPCL